MLRTARKFVSDAKIRLALEKITGQEELTQILLLMMLDSGLELRKILFGSQVVLKAPELLLVKDILTVVGTTKKDDIVYFDLYS